VPRRDLPGQHGLRALIQAPQQGPGGGDDDEGHQHGAGADAALGGAEGLFGGVVKTPGFTGFGRVALHHGHRVEHLGSDGARVGDAVLAGTRELAHPTSVDDGRQEQQHQAADHLGHHHRVGDDEHDQGAHAHDGVAQPHGHAGAHHGLDEGGVGREARDHLTGLRGFEELGALPQHVGVHGFFQVGGDAFAQPAHHEVARGREHAQRRAHPKQREEVLAHLHQPLARVAGDQALVDQQAQRHGQGQGGQRGEHQKHPRQHQVQAVRTHEGPQRREGARGGARRGGTAKVVVVHVRRSACQIMVWPAEGARLA